jgi:hypothetical protein
MAERYRDHLIFVRTTLDPEARLWTVSAHIQFNERPHLFHDVPLPRPATLFATEKEAEKYMVRQARTWVDDRLGETKQQEAAPKFRLSALWRSLLAVLANHGAKANGSNSLKVLLLAAGLLNS